VEIRVGYSSHVFTVKCPINELPDARLGKPHDPRIFSPIRYQHSLQLPLIVQNLHTRRCYATDQGNYFVVDMIDALSLSTEYWVFFHIRKCADQYAIILFVESAYPGDIGRAPYGRKRQSHLFRSVVSKALGVVADFSL
jgi:hypothetical protein